MKKSAVKFSEALILAALAISVRPSTSLAVHHGDFFGTTGFAYNQLSYDQPLWNSGLSNARRDLLWSKVKPTPGVYDDAYPREELGSWHFHEYFFVHAITVSLLATVPEPSTAVVLLAGGGLMALRRRKRKMLCD